MAASEQSTATAADEARGPQPLYRPADVAAHQPDPGQFPYTRGIYPDMYRTRLWTMRQYAGFGSARETNERFRYLLGQGQMGLSVAFDLPTQLGLDSDDSRAEGEVGKVGVAIDSVEDMAVLLAEIPLDRVSTSMTINAPASLLLLMYELVGERQGVASTQLTGTIQNDILKEYAARGTYIFPPRPSMRLITDTFAYCREHIPRWNTISISGYHIREAGATAAQELAFTLADGVAYVEAALAAGLKVDEFAPRLSFFFNAHSNFFEEIAKFRAARRMWARIMRDRFGARDERALQMRFHTQTAGSTLTSQQPLNNVVRTTVEAMAAVLGGTQSLHTNGYDEALALPTAEAATLALRTQQIIAHESGIPQVADPLGGSYYVEALTDQLEREADVLLDKVDSIGGAVRAIEVGMIQQAIADAAWETQQAIERGEQIVVGVNRFGGAEQQSVPVFYPSEEVAREQATALKQIRAGREAGAVAAALEDIRRAARGSANLLVPMREALRELATLGEICKVLRDEWGEYHPDVVV